jgi:RNA polymerase sigma-70 factor (ECF subfamily)
VPDPIVSEPDGAEPEQEAVLADSVGLALLVVLETLAPPERLPFVLHDMFAVPFEEIAPMLDRTPEATRQLASRARRRIRGASAQPDPDLSRQRRVVDAFLAAARAGDFEQLLQILHPDVAFHVDRGPGGPAVPPVLVGLQAVARQAADQGPRFATMCRPALVNGAAGLLVHGARGPIGVVGMTVVDDLITEIDLVLDPDKLSALRAADPSAG